MNQPLQSDAFDALLARHSELQRQHELACECLAEEPGRYRYQRCVRLYDEMTALQEQIDASIEAERAREAQAQPTRGDTHDQ